jgi:hypothetical protein
MKRALEPVQRGAFCSCTAKGFGHAASPAAVQLGTVFLYGREGLELDLDLQRPRQVVRLSAVLSYNPTD